jgi:hypothetical protein
VMRSPFYSFRAVLATGVSLWMAVLACLMGCTVPILASSGPYKAPWARESSAEQNQPDTMADMPNCPHHSRGTVPAKPNGGKPVRGGEMSCCPVEVTVTSKPDTITLHIAPASNFVLASEFTLATIRIFHSAQFVPPVWHSGRDKLLETQLLRI